MIEKKFILDHLQTVLQVKSNFIFSHLWVNLNLPVYSDPIENEKTLNDPNFDVCQTFDVQSTVHSDKFL